MRRETQCRNAQNKNPRPARVPLRAVWMTSGLWLAGVVIWVSATGCAVKSAVAPRNNFTLPAQVSFPKESMRMNRVSLFLWPEDVTAAKMSRVIQLGDQADALEMRSGPLSEQVDALAVQLKPVLKEISTQEGELRSLKKKITDKQNEIKVAPEAEKEKLKMALLEMSEQKIAFETKIAELKKDIRFAEQLALETEQEENNTRMQEHLAELKELVHFFDPPPTYINFHFEADESFVISIAGWMLDDQPRDFSSRSVEGAAPTITNVAFTELGGRIQFDVVVNDLIDPTQLKEIFEFRLARANQNRKDGKVYFAGEFRRKVPLGNGQFKETRGIAKLVDKNS